MLASKHLGVPRRGAAEACVGSAGGERGGGRISQLQWPLGLLWERRALLEVGIVALVGTSEEGCLRFRAEWAR